MSPVASLRSQLKAGLRDAEPLLTPAATFSRMGGAEWKPRRTRYASPGLQSETLS
jgi:hypothetical protein